MVLRLSLKANMYFYFLIFMTISFFILSLSLKFYEIKKIFFLAILLIKKIPKILSRNKKISTDSISLEIEEKISTENISKEKQQILPFSA